MSNGAAGCGWEFNHLPNMWKCGFLSVENYTGQNTPEDNKKESTVFVCSKYNNEILDKQPTTGHPFRCTKCTKSV